MECQYCHNEFSNKTSLNTHQSTAKYCLKLRQVKSQNEFKCPACGRGFVREYHLHRHAQVCPMIGRCEEFKLQMEELRSRIERKCESRIQTHLGKHNKEVSILKTELDAMKVDYKELLESYQRLAELYVLDGKNKVEVLNKKFLKKRARTRFEGQNVIYVLTTPGLKKERRYILGKATNLTNRLSTYNKTDEHEVVFYSSCPDKEKMSLVEGLVFDKLRGCREQANRERFILPEDRNIDFFSETIKKCIEFVK